MKLIEVTQDKKLIKHLDSRIYQDIAMDFENNIPVKGEMLFVEGNWYEVHLTVRNFDKSELFVYVILRGAFNPYGKFSPI